VNLGDLRVGSGFDTHTFSADPARPLVLGGGRLKDVLYTVSAFTQLSNPPLAIGLQLAPSHLAMQPTENPPA